MFHRQCQDSVLTDSDSRFLQLVSYLFQKENTGYLKSSQGKAHGFLVGRLYLIRTGMWSKWKRDLVGSNSPVPTREPSKFRTVTRYTLGNNHQILVNASTRCQLKI